MSRMLFLRIVNSIREFDNYFKCKKDCTGTLGFTSIQKCMTAKLLNSVRYLRYCGRNSGSITLPLLVYRCVRK